jgi:cell fate (sporulation/competence/biofilm development) regulator YlbF (YheA/YmcA/DUF963 family)
MDVIKMTRDLGKAIQADERYTFFADVKKEMENDSELQAKIGQFNLDRLNMQEQMGNGEMNTKELGERIKASYTEIMSNPLMGKFEDAKAVLDDLLSQINTIIEGCVNGLDPETCPAISNCGGSCSTCGGCG